MPAAPLPPSDPEPAPPGRDPIAAWTGPVPPLDRTALIGIVNLGTGRKALLRLPNGRYRSAIVGDVLDAWRVSVIGAEAMRITRSGEDRTFLLVNR